MLINVKEENCNKENLTLGSFFYLLFCNCSKDIIEDIQTLITQGHITSAGCSNGYRITNKGLNVINDIMADSVITEKDDEKIKRIAEGLKQVFPQGRKHNTSLYWTEGTPLIIKRLKLFKKKYDVELDYNKFISAAENYVKSFAGDYRFMKVLKYFIFKEKRGEAGEVESESDLLTYLENANQVNDTQQEINWDVELR